MTRLALALLLVLTSFGAQSQNAIPAAPELGAKAYLLIDANSGEVLVEHNADTQLPPASLTKMMTAYVLAEEIQAGRVKEDDMVTISENAWSQNPVFNGSSLMWIEPGKDVSIADLQRGIIISSGNDSSVAVAEHIAGTEAVFAEMMNTNAERLGMTNTYYVNSHGLPDPAHLTTARDLAILAKAMINDHPEQYAIYKELEYTYNNIRQYNRNTLLLQDSSVDGLKTGHTKEAGYCLVASAERRGMRLISVVMGTNSTKARKNDTAALLNYGFRFYQTETAFEPMTELAKPRVWKGMQDYVPVGLLDKVVLTLPRGKHDELVTDVVLNAEIEAPLAVGDPVGTVTVTLDGETKLQSPAVALVAVEEAGFFARLWDTVLMFIANLFGAR
ncbi:D-alanyl-D-alanine carboxypeptidase DacC [Halioglobus japonicus]|nr:D-alanyl-D-alanine carboxypeptidase DacC [Halioglobus japonicus]